MTDNSKTVVENINCPGKTSRVNTEKYEAMKAALLQAIPMSNDVPQRGITQNEMQLAIQAFLPNSLWPNGEKSGWWAKTVQLDLEAKLLLKRTDTKPLRWYKTSPGN